MTAKSHNYMQYNREIVQEIFLKKEEYHRAQARLPIEEKMKKLVELQKIALTIRPKRDENDPRFVWRI